MKRALSVSATMIGIFLFGSVRSAPPGGQYVDINLPPVATFKNYCARCHGYEGAAYGKGFANINEDSLKSVIEDMMFGPAGLNPDSVSIAAMVAYNSALSRKIPFAAVLNARSFFNDRDSALSIEASPGAVVEGADSVKPGKANSVLWSMPFDRSEEKSIWIAVTRKGVSSKIRFPEELWSR